MLINVNIKCCMQQKPKKRFLTLSYKDTLGNLFLPLHLFSTVLSTLFPLHIIFKDFFDIWRIFLLVFIFMKHHYLIAVIHIGIGGDIVICPVLQTFVFFVVVCFILFLFLFICVSIYLFWCRTPRWWVNTF